MFRLVLLIACLLNLSARAEQTPVAPSCQTAAGEDTQLFGGKSARQFFLERSTAQTDCVAQYQQAAQAYSQARTDLKRLVDSHAPAAQIDAQEAQLGTLRDPFLGLLEKCGPCAANPGQPPIEIPTASKTQYWYKSDGSCQLPITDRQQLEAAFDHLSDILVHVKAYPKQADGGGFDQILGLSVINNTTGLVDPNADRINPDPTYLYISVFGPVIGLPTAFSYYFKNTYQTDQEAGVRKFALKFDSAKPPRAFHVPTTLSFSTSSGKSKIALNQSLTDVTGSWYLTSDGYLRYCTAADFKIGTSYVETTGHSIMLNTNLSSLAKSGGSPVIARYRRAKMAAIWSEEAQFQTWLDIEVLACEGWAKIGKIPADALSEIRERAGFDTAAVLEKEKETKHDVAAFVSVVQARIGAAGRYVHLGMTSSDVVDTAFAYRLVKSADLILEELESCLEITKARALKERDIPMMGRTHGIHAEPLTMGMKWLLWHDQLKRARRRLKDAKEEISVGKISGAVGNSHIPPEVEKHVCDRLGLKVDTVSTQVISRDRFAAYFSALGLLGSVIEGIAVELRHLQRTEVSEVREGFSKGQKGSSAMPHKRNPISAENLTGLARLLRSMVIPAMENCALWHERDISHSSVERVIGPDANLLADFMLARLGGLLRGLEIFPQKMQENLALLQGVVYSQPVLLALVEKGLSRDEAYEIVQKNALSALDRKVPFLSLLKADSRVTKVLSEESLSVLFEPSRYLNHLDYIYQKVLGDETREKVTDSGRQS